MSETVATSGRGPVKKGRMSRKNTAAASVGSAIEFYDLSIYGYLAATFAPLFFPSDSAAASLIAAFAVFGVAYLARPLGAVFFGWIADRMGRRPALVGTILTMGVSATLIGLLPTYATIGVAAPILMLLLRMASGLSAGGELYSAVAFTSESAPAGKKGFHTSLVVGSTFIGFSSAVFVVAIVSSVLSAEQMVTWGWRIPFLICLPLTIASMWLRRQIHESEEFEKKVVAQARIKQTIPLVDLFRNHWRSVGKVFLIAVAINAPTYLGLTYLASYFVVNRELPSTSVYLLAGIGVLGSALLSPVAGMLVDRLGRRFTLALGLGMSVVLTYPLLLLMTLTESIFLLGVLYFVFMAMVPFYNCAAVQLFVDIFPTEVRTTGAAVGQNAGTALAGGFGPVIAASLVAATGSLAAPSFFVIGAGILGLIVLVFTPLKHGNGSAHTKDILEPAASSVASQD
ncbi:MFS transporter [Rhodococcus sp. DMU1]|uniref:MFS transporter n=1 Tax=Rhodococcus sp. DMU1 TaxID=2722825 RepID=UPI00143ECB6B|nr:MFS transporter [Rhodococcus sp. DMU1]QIX53863.1 MHS family MFS transporter [Rhodococcus sp. DMU1]